MVQKISLFDLAEKLQDALDKKSIKGVGIEEVVYIAKQMGVAKALADLLEKHEDLIMSMPDLRDTIKHHIYATANKAEVKIR